jgi:16S rRNA (adenine1518-N6/adenine1519-N6)-dimethyltransferase
MMAYPDSQTRIAPKQSLGQNFLIDENIVRNIIREFQPTEHDVVVEIGPGQGALTAHLAGHVRHLVLIEIDGRIIEQLEEKFSSPSVTILHDDVLDVDFVKLQKKFGERLRVIGNLPYHMTSPILFKIFDEATAVRDLTIMVQREVAERITATPGGKEYGILAVMTGFYGTPKAHFTVSPNCFYPKPKVTSTVMSIRLHDTPSYEAVDREAFRLVVRTTFGKRRKTLRNSLRYLPYDESVLSRALAESPISLEKRPEQLTLDEFIILTQHIRAQMQ